MADQEPGRMKRRDIILAILSLCSERPEFGRTSLQKVAYFCGLDLGRDLGHRAHYYGPFSEIVEQEVDALTLSELIVEKTTWLGFAAPGGSEARRYEYKLTDSGLERIELLRQSYPSEFRQIAQVIDKLVDVVGSLDQRILSPAAKTLFIAREQGRMLTTKEISTQANWMGWDLPETEVQRVTDVLSELGYAHATN